MAPNIACKVCWRKICALFSRKYIGAKIAHFCLECILAQTLRSFVSKVFWRKIAHFCLESILAQKMRTFVSKLFWRKNCALLSRNYFLRQLKCLIDILSHKNLSYILGDHSITVSEKISKISTKKVLKIITLQTSSRFLWKISEKIFNKPLRTQKLQPRKTEKLGSKPNSIYSARELRGNIFFNPSKKGLMKKNIYKYGGRKRFGATPK